MIRLIIGSSSDLLFYCPGCEQYHAVNIKDDNRPKWKFNGSYTDPTFSPSILVTRPGQKFRCHSFVEKGKIRYLDDCTHKLAGKTIEIPIEEGEYVKRI